MIVDAAWITSLETGSNPVRSTRKSPTQIELGFFVMETIYKDAVMTEISVRTYRDLLEKLQACSKEQLDQPIQVVKGHPVDEYVYELQAAVCFATVDDLDLRYARSVTDNRRHGEELVIYTDGNPHGECGAIAYEMKGDLDSLKDNPIYPKGHDESADWTGPAQALVDAKERPEGKGTLGPVLLHRFEKFDEKD